MVRQLCLIFERSGLALLQVLLFLLIDLVYFNQFSGHLRNGFDSLFALDICLSFAGLIGHLLFTLFVILAEIQIESVKVVL